MTKSEEIPIIRDALLRYEAASGAKVNSGKSRALAVGSCERLQHHEHLLLCRGNDTGLPFLEHSKCLCVQELFQADGKISSTSTVCVFQRPESKQPNKFHP